MIKKCTVKSDFQKHIKALLWTTLFEACGHGSARFDCRISDDHNIHVPSGLLIMAEMMVHTKASLGMVLFEPTCGSWGWVNLGTSLRSVDALNQV